LANILEAEGLSTVAISLVRAQAERGRAPRVLHCEFPLGRPLGRPCDAPLQRRVLLAALSLLPRTDVPVLTEFPEVIVDEADIPLACPLPPRHDPSVHPAVDEAIGLMPAYRRTHDATGRTGVVRCGGPERIPELCAQIATLLESAKTSSGEEVTDLDLTAAALDIRAYYEEAALSLIEHIPAARQAESWFYRATAAGQLLRRVHALLRDDGAPRAQWFALVPSGQEIPRLST
jgi:hypothetical protein